MAKLSKILPVLVLLALLALGGRLAWRLFQDARCEALLQEELRKVDSAPKQEPAAPAAAPVNTLFQESREGGEYRSFSGAYAGEARPLITADAAAELFYRQLERALGGASRTFLYDQYASLFVDLMENLEARHEKQEDTDRLLTRDALYFAAVCVKLLLPEARLPIPVLVEAEEEAQLIREGTYIGERRGRPADYTAYAGLEPQELLKAYLLRNYYAPGREEVRKVLWILADTLFHSSISAQSYGEILRFEAARDGQEPLLCLRDIWQAQTNALAQVQGEGEAPLPGGFLPCPSEDLWRELEKRAVTDFDPPPWRDPAHIAEAAPKVWFLPPASSLAEKTFRELHRWAVPPRTAHLLFALGLPAELPEAEKAILKAGADRPGLADRAAQAAGKLKTPAPGTREALWARARLALAAPPAKEVREVEWPPIEGVLVEAEPEYYEALAALSRELGDLYEELDLFHLMASYGEPQLTQDKLLETEQILGELADMARSQKEEDDFTLERRLLTGRRFLTLLKSLEEGAAPCAGEIPLGLEYNFERKLTASVTGVGRIAGTARDGRTYKGPRYLFREGAQNIEIKENK